MYCGLQAPTSTMSTCRGCGAAIRWVRGVNKAHPVDPEPLTVWITPTQRGMMAPKIVLVTDEGQVVSGWEASPLVEDAREWVGYTSHFATCPKAEEFRGKSHARQE